MAYTDNMEKKLQIIFGDVTFGVKGEDFQYIFSYQTGGPESFYAAGREWLYRTPNLPNQNSSRFFILPNFSINIITAN